MDIEAQTEAFKKLLGEDHNEQVYQDFMERHTRFIPREFLLNHQVANRIALRKLRLGSDYASDFFYFSKNSDSWRAIHIEIEKPTSKFFRPNSNTLSSEFHAAVDQVKHWIGWFDNHANREQFVSSVRALMLPRAMSVHPTHHRFVLVYGRRDEYADDPVRRGLIRASETPDFSIMTFDSLMEALDQKPDLMIGVRHNEFIELRGDEIVSEPLFAYMVPTQFEVSRALHEKLKAGDPRKTSILPGLSIEDPLIRASKAIRVRSG